ncbi:MAG: DUF3472 domain-containing protein [Bacteroidales bacterium]|nr:DUF3472 domain-containing protein [Bacteroidales bacterium]
MSRFSLMMTLVLGILLAGCSGDHNQLPVYTTSVPVAGNSWVMNDLAMNQRIIGSNGVVNGTDPQTTISTFFKTGGTGNIDVAVIARVVSGKSSIGFTLACDNRKVTISGTEFDTIHVGTFNLTSAGYQSLGMNGLRKSDSVYAEVREVLIGGEALGENVVFIRDDFYFGRRGPSVHLRYSVPDTAGDIVLFYNKVTVPVENDIPGSFFMANGFSHGYFGIQVNSDTERTILFSVWSPFQTDNPSEIPESDRIVLLDKGEDVVTGSFGNEGSGGQSFKRFYWKAGTTYGFLLRGEQKVKGSTDYSAWFFDPEAGEWQLIASFRRPKTETWLKNLHSFLENFRPETGPIPRQGLYSNQWVCNRDGEWFELTEAMFTADATARKDARHDYAGGSDGSSFFLRNCGFFNVRTRINTTLSREYTGNLPDRLGIGD